MNTKSILKDTLRLVVITLIAGLILSLVYQLTKDRIADAEARELTESYQTVMPEAYSFSEVGDAFDLENEYSDIFGSAVSLNSALYALDESGDVIGCVLSVTSHEGYGGDITMTVGITSGGTVSGVRVTSMSETSGLGANCQNESWISQFTGLFGTVSYTKTGATAENEIDAISGATRTTRAVTNAVNAALEFAGEHFGFERGNS